MADTVDMSAVQGNILKAFDKEYMRLLFFQFQNNSNDAKKWLAGLANSGKIPNTYELKIPAEREKKAGTNYRITPKTYLHVSLTAKGILKLGLPIPPSKGIYEGKGKASKVNNQTVTQDDPFARGMKSRASILADTGENHYANWVKPFRDNSLDALVVVASDTDEVAEKESIDILGKAEKAGVRPVGMEKGKALYEDAQRRKGRIEHFGFRDGLSQPLIKGIDDRKIAKRLVNKDAFDPEDFVLFGLSGNLEWANNGSFLALRRLKQDVHGFWNFVARLSRELGLTREEIFAKFMGRYRDGKSLERYSRATSTLSQDYNDFDYRRDPAGSQTPAFSHIRKTNPRSSPSNDSDRHRILRRGITYGSQAKAAPDHEDRGLLFICYQRDLEMQFEYIQQALASNPNFPISGAGHDPIIGRPTPGTASIVRIAGAKIGVNRWVTTTGGEYFFSPSIPALKNLQKTGTESKPDRPKPPGLSRSNFAGQIGRQLSNNV